LPLRQRQEIQKVLWCAIGTALSVSRAVGEAEIDLTATHGELVKIEEDIAAAKAKHNAFLKELGQNPLP
jgi:hypothetical protein